MIVVNTVVLLVHLVLLHSLDLRPSKLLLIHHHLRRRDPPFLVSPASHLHCLHHHRLLFARLMTNLCRLNKFLFELRGRYEGMPAEAATTQPLEAAALCQGERVCSLVQIKSFQGQAQLENLTGLEWPME
jgi:hypothetical protein